MEDIKKRNSQKEKKQLQNRKDYLRRRFWSRMGRIPSFIIELSYYFINHIFPIKFRKRIGKMILKIDSLEKMILFGLIILLTLFSIRETIIFLNEIEQDHNGVLLKAILTEGIILVFSWISFSRFSLQTLKLLVLLGACFYSLFTTSGKVLFSGIQEFRNTASLSGIISGLEKEIGDKQKVRESYVETKRLSAARKLDEKIDQLQEELLNFKHQSSKVQAPVVVQIKALGMTFFRVIALIANVLCMHAFASLFRKQSPLEVVSHRANLVLVKG